MSLTKNTKNLIYQRISEQATTYGDEELIDIVESVIGPNYKITVEGNGSRKNIQIGEGKDKFTLSLLSEFDQEDSNLQQLNG